MPIQTAEQARRVFKTPRDLTRTSAGRVRSEITDLQRQPDLSKSETGRLKELRSDWNRNLKYTPTGMALSGATSPLDAQNRFMRSTEDFRQINPRAYGTMYPLSQGAMKLGEYGGLLGLGVRALTGKFGEWGKGLTSLVDSDKDEQDEYIAKTFGPNQPFYPEDVHPGLPIDDVPLLVDEEPEAPDASSALYELDEEEIQESPLPFDEGREDYIAASGMNPNLLRQEKLRGMGEIPENFVPGGSPQADRYYAEVDPGINVEFGDNVAPPPINYRDDPRTESGIANLMPSGMPWAQRLRLMDTAKRLKEGPHRNEPRTSYYGRNWFDEYNRKMRNEMEVARGIRSPMDR